MRTGDTKQVNIGLALISTSMLIFEIALTRLFAIQQFHHFAFMVVSLAVLGISAGGTLLAVTSRRPCPGLPSILFFCSIGLAYLVIHSLPFDSYRIAWDRRQIGILAAYFLSAAAPFFFAGWTISAELSQAGAEAQRPYAASLLGSALGCLAVLGLFPLAGDVGTLAFAMAIGSLGASFLTVRPGIRRNLLALSALLIALGLAPPEGWDLPLSPYKPLSTTLLYPGARKTLGLESPSTRLEVVESDAIHVFPGLSLSAPGVLPLQAAVFLDGEGPIPISALDPDSPQAGVLAAHMPASVAYHLRPGPNALVLNAGAGLDVALALASGATHVTLSNPEPLITYTLAGPYLEFSHGLFMDPRITILQRSDRGALAIGSHPYDLIQLALSDPYRPVTSGAFSLSENYLLTQEAFQSAYQRLSESGLLVITRWLGTPPTEAARAWATLLAAMEAADVDSIETHLVAYRGMRTATMIASRQPFSPSELTALRSFLFENAFDPIYLPGLRPDELNRFNVLPQDRYHSLFDALLGHRSATLKAYDFNLQPPSDDRPFFFHFFRWRQTPDVLAALGMTWQPFGGSGYLVMMLLLALMAALALPLALSPMAAHIHRPGFARPRVRSLAYFAFLGAGYLWVEIPLIQRFTLLLDRPAWSLTCVLFTLLLTSGIGSLLAPRLPLRKIILLLVVAIPLTIGAVPAATHIALSWSFAARLALVAILLAPLGLAMGVPFPSGLRSLEAQQPGFIPWAWAINGAISGVSGVLAALIGLQWGFSATLLAAGLAYLGALLTIPSEASQARLRSAQR